MFFIFFLNSLSNCTGISTFIRGEVSIRGSAKTQLGVISLKLQLCPFRVCAFEWLQYLLLFFFFLIFLNKDARRFGLAFSKACLYFLMLSVLKVVYIPFPYMLCVFRSSWLKQHY